MSTTTKTTAVDPVAEFELRAARAEAQLQAERQAAADAANSKNAANAAFAAKMRPGLFASELEAKNAARDFAANGKRVLAAVSSELDDTQCLLVRQGLAAACAVVAEGYESQGVRQYGRRFYESSWRGKMKAHLYSKEVEGWILDTLVSNGILGRGQRGGLFFPSPSAGPVKTRSQVLAEMEEYM